MTFGHAQPIAIVGIGCRFPGGITGPERLWDVLEKGVDAISPIPEKRWDVERFYSPKAGQPGRISSRHGGFLDEIDTFDAAFFGISGRVAEQMDPQQRHLLEVSWEALEDAGIVPGSLAGSSAGVFIGACSQDYGALQSAPSELSGLGPHSATGTFMSIVSNRLSYTYDLRGPSMTIDTACSSSLVAVHLGVQSLRSGEADLALVGGVNLMLTPQFGIALSQAAMLSPDGRSRAFDKSANGYVRGEGVGVVVLKPLDRARQDNDRIYAVLHGTAVNQDGRTQGITVPSGKSQEANFRAALAAAGITPAQLGYVEAHGTGTPVGDPIEANALGAVLRAEGGSRPAALLGSIKTNVGHLEAAAGIAGLIKAALCVQRRRIPPSLHFREGNPDIDFAGLPISVAAKAQPWPAEYPVAVASVNSFGFGGTNANVVLAEDIAETSETCPRTIASDPGNTEEPNAEHPTVLTFSARSAEALTALAAQHAHQLTNSVADVADYAAATALRRSHHEYRRAVVATKPAEAAAKLRAGEVIDGHVPRGTTRKVAFLFNGQGPQWYAMGRTLLETSSVFRDKILECDRVAKDFLDWSIYQELTADEQASKINQTRYLQPAMFAVQVALAALWESWGISPDAVLGHSMGEIAAAYTAGGLSLKTALKVICHRARIQDRADPSGGMLFVALPEDQVRALCAEHPGEVWVSAVNSPRATTVSGRRPILDALAAELTDRGVFARVLRVNCACHSPDMDPLRDDLLAALGDVEHQDTAIALYSTLTGARIEGHQLSADYWWRNFRQPVLFESAIRAMIADGYDTFLELSPHPVLANSVSEISADVLVLSSLARKKGDWAVFLDSFARLYTNGCAIDWKRRYPAGAPALAVPTNPWIRESFWNETATSRQYRAGGQQHPMLKPVDGTRPTWEVSWDDHRLSWVREHDVFGSVIVPGAAYVEAALAAAGEATGKPCALEFVEFERACVLSDEPQTGRLEIDPEDGTFEICHRAFGGDTWIRNAHGRLYVASTEVTNPTVVDLPAVRQRCDRAVGALDVYGRFARRGYAYGPAFCGIEKIHLGSGEALARIQVPRVLRNRLTGYLLHPAVLDACFQSAILHPTTDNPDELLPICFLPTGIERIRVHRQLSAPLWCYTKVRRNDETLLVDIYLLDEEGTVTAEYTSLTGKAVQYREENLSERLDEHFYTLDWQSSTGFAPPRSAVTTGPTQLAAQASATAAQLSRRLDRSGYATDYQREMARLGAGYVARCLNEWQLPALFTVVDIPDLLPKYRRAMLGLLQLAQSEGVVTESEGRFGLAQPFVDDTDAQWSDMFSRYPACAWELLLLRQTAPRLHDVLVGRADPLELLVSDDSPVDLAAIYQNSPIARFYNALAARVLRQVVDTADPRRTLRVLEVGGGTGGLTASLLPVLPADRCEYLFTDVSPAFLATAREQFSGYEFVEFRVLDLEHELAAQGIEPGTFDLVVASDVVHATTDARKTLLYLQDLLASGGLLMVLEAAPDNPWLDLTFGLTDGWWLFRDQRFSPQTPLLPAQGWCELLRSVGFDDVAAFGDPTHTTSGSQSLVVARYEGQPQAQGMPELIEPTEPVGTWVILDSGDPLAATLADRVHEYGGHALRVSTLEDIDTTTCSVLVDTRTRRDSDRLEEALTTATLDVIDVLRRVCRGDAAEWPTVVAVTRGAHAYRNHEVDLTGAAVWGLATTVGVELPDLRFTAVDLDPEPADTDLHIVWRAAFGDGREREVLARAGERFVRRLVPRGPRPITETGATLPLSSGFRLTTEAPGALDTLHYRSYERVAPGAGEVEIEVFAAGLNFLDVMMALGQIPPLESVRGHLFGAEGAGIVTRVGSGVTGLRVGAEVVLVSPGQGTMGSHVTVSADHVVHKPAGLGFEAASSIPIVFLTAWYALHELARVAEAERVLIHAAAGGTGLAAVQIARLAGAEVFATAGTPAKRELLRTLGVRQVFDSRSLDFADQIMAATGGQGVDVVLNSLAGETAARSLACLAPYGRFIELGKRDLLADRRLGLRPFLNNLSYHAFDLRQLLVDRPRATQVVFRDLMDRFATGQLRPLPHRLFRSTQTETAFRQLAAARHIGKIVVTMDDDIRVAVPRRAPELTGTWLITGGMGGFGLAMAESLAAAGVRNLVLLGRSELGDDERAARVTALRGRGVRVVTETVDVSSREQVAGVLERIESTGPPLRGVLHCAMVLDDALIAETTPESVRKVLAGKAFGAWHLHELTARLPLEAFVLFSSATSLVGNRGQANYAVANTVLDMLAGLRRAQGQVALSVNWGAISDVGYVSRNDDIRRFVTATGMRGFSATAAYHALTTLWSGRDAQVGVIPMDWSAFFGHHGLTSETHPRYQHITGKATSVATAATGSLRQQLEAAGQADHSELVIEALRGRLAGVLGIPLDTLDDTMPLMDYLDSLLAVEISAWLERELGTKITIMELMKGPSVLELSELVLDRLDRR